MAAYYFRHYSEIDRNVWHWPNFQPKEIASRGDGSVIVDTHALDTLQRAREIAGKPFILHSAYRDEMHNALVGGSPRSYHLEGRAFDISLRSFSKTELVGILRHAGFTGLGVRYRSFVHADTRRWREW